jgi:pyridoxamine 5'-phosphate oxidase
MSDQLKDLRTDYTLGELGDEGHPSCPFQFLTDWLEEARLQAIKDFNACDLATVDLEGFPTSRIVLLKGIEAEALCFYTNYRSAKGAQLAASPKASMNLFWSALERQVRVRGVVHKLSAEASNEYFSTRPRESQIGAWASPQSSVIKNRSELDSYFSNKKLEFSKNNQISRPDFWGGYGLTPDKFEFWQGRPSRLHDRLVCAKSDSGWTWLRLAP